ncbi:MAG: arsenate reductase (glutaredoxin) [Chrysiogenetes bacterium]|nr:arsenate reductase (glutaredoxin) [Chrysiogenetes bacterium]
MAKITIYHNPRCSKSRQTLALLEDAGASIEVVEYLQTPPSASELAEIVKMLGVAPMEIVRKKEAEFKELGLDQKVPADAKLLELLSKNPRLIERPIVVKGKKAVIGRPPENVNALL